MAGEAAHVHFVDDGPRGGPVERRVAFPIVRTRIDDDTLHRRCTIVAFVSRSVATVILRNNGAASVWIEEDFGRIEAHSARRIVWPLNSIAVDLRRLSLPARIRASSDTCGWLRDRWGSHAPAEHHRRDQRGAARFLLRASSRRKSLPLQEKGLRPGDNSDLLWFLVPTVETLGITQFLYQWSDGYHALTRASRERFHPEPTLALSKGSK